MFKIDFTYRVESSTRPLRVCLDVLLMFDLLFAIFPPAAWVRSLMQTQTLTLVVFIKCEFNFRNNLVRGEQDGTPGHCPLKSILQRCCSTAQCHCVHNVSNLPSADPPDQLHFDSLKALSGIAHQVFVKERHTFPLGRPGKSGTTFQSWWQ